MSKNLEENRFYFIIEEYFQKFKDDGLMQNHKMINNTKHDRPSFYAFKDKNNSQIYWMIPVSSQIDKYDTIRKNKIKRYNRCNTIVLGNILNKRNAFLIQNMFPVTSKYIDKQYKKSNKAVTISNTLEKDLVKKAGQVLYLVEEKNFKKLLYPNVEKIKNELIQQLKLENQKLQQEVSNQQIELNKTSNSTKSNEKVNILLKSKEFNADNNISNNMIKSKKVKGRFSVKYCPALGEKAPEKEPAIKPIKRKPGIQPQRQANNEKFVQLLQ